MKDEAEIKLQVIFKITVQSLGGISMLHSAVFIIAVNWLRLKKQTGDDEGALNR